jgi:threonine synthase
MQSYLSHLECTACHATCDASRLQTLCPACGKVLYARYDLDAARRGFSRETLASRAGGMWRWFELMPVRDEGRVVTLGEGSTPLLPAEALQRQAGARRIWIKEEGLNPTGSFKARGLSAAVSKARELGVTKIAIPSAGNAGSALAAYGARAGMETYVFVPDDTPATIVDEAAAYGANVVLVDGLINHAGRIVRENTASRGWFDVSTLREPYRAEGKKTMGLELAEQLGWTLPDVVVYPTGGGTGIVGMWKAWDELEALGWIGPQRPRVVSVQAAGCAPIVRAYEAGASASEVWQNATTIAPGIRVPAVIADYLILDAVRTSNGTALAVSDAEILDAMRELARLEGLFAAPEGAATWAGYSKLLARGVLAPDESVVLFNTGAGIKTPDLLHAELPRMRPGDQIPVIQETIF